MTWIPVDKQESKASKVKKDDEKEFKLSMPI